MLNRLDLLDHIGKKAGKYDKQILEGLALLPLDSNFYPIPIIKSDIARKLKQSGSTLSPHINSLIEKRYIISKIIESEKKREKHECLLTLTGFCYLMALKWEGTSNLLISSSVPESYSEYENYFSHNQQLHPSFSLIRNERLKKGISGQLSYIDELVWVMLIAAIFWYRWYIHYEFKKEQIVYQQYYFQGDHSATFWYYLLVSALDQCFKPNTKRLVHDVIIPELKTDQKNWIQLKEKMDNLCKQSRLQVEILSEL